MDMARRSGYIPKNWREGAIDQTERIIKTKIEFGKVIPDIIDSHRLILTAGGVC